MSVCCEFCRRDCLCYAYSPDGSTRRLKVYICRHCALVQSLPRIARTSQRHGPAISGGADWGNVRYGKGFRATHALDRLARHTERNARLTLLDVGSNRGSFTKAFVEAWPHAKVTAIEPDERLASSLVGVGRAELVCSRIEDTNLAGAQFDIVHSCHTIEHLGAPFAALKDHARVLKDDGLLLIEAPNIELIDQHDIIEEWFIDKHLFHFSARTLSRMIQQSGFTIIEANDPNDRVNLSFLARKTAKPSEIVHADPAEVAWAEWRLERYAKIRSQNLAALLSAAREIQSLQPRRIGMWGAGRLFDIFVRRGKFDPSCLTLLIDKNLKDHTQSRHGVALASADDLDDARVDIVVVMSRMFADEIAREIRHRAPKAQIILFTDLLARARLWEAA